MLGSRLSNDPRPVALVTSVVSPYRREPFRLLAERQGAEVIAWEGAGAAGAGAHGAPHHPGRGRPPRRAPAATER